MVTKEQILLAIEKGVEFRLKAFKDLMALKNQDDEGRDLLGRSRSIKSRAAFIERDSFGRRVLQKI